MKNERQVERLDKIDEISTDLWLKRHSEKVEKEENFDDEENDEKVGAQK